MSNSASQRTLARFRFAALAALAVTFAGLGVPAVFASEPIVCDNKNPLTAELPEARAQLGWAIHVNRTANETWLAAGANLDNTRGIDSGAVADALESPAGSKTESRDRS